MMKQVAERADFNRRNIKGKMFDRTIRALNTILTDGITRAEFEVRDRKNYKKYLQREYFQTERIFTKNQDKKWL